VSPFEIISVVPSLHQVEISKLFVTAVSSGFKNIFRAYTYTYELGCTDVFKEIQRVDTFSMIQVVN